MTPRTISKQRLAALYFPDTNPHAAMERLRRWIAHVDGLREKLAQLSPGKHAKYFTRRQVELIFHYLDEPGD